MIEFDWDPDKEAENARRRGIDFYDAMAALRDPFAIGWFDEEHSIAEPRFVTIGRDLRSRFLAVVQGADLSCPLEGDLLDKASLALTDPKTLDAFGLRATGDLITAIAGKLLDSSTIGDQERDLKSVVLA